MKKRKDGRYQIKVTLQDGKIHHVYGKTIAEATQAANNLRALEHAGLNVSDNTTVGEWAKIWLNKYKSDLRPATVNMYKNAYNVHIMEYLGTMKLKDVKPVHVKNVMSHCAGLSESMQTKVLITLKQILHTARHNGLLIGDPVDGIKITKHKRAKKKKCLSEDEQKELFKNIDDPRNLIFCGLCVYCGLRREEALGLQWGDINGKELTVNRTVTFPNNNLPLVSQELKTNAAHRTIPIPDKLIKILTDIPRKGLFVITTPDGAPITFTGFIRMWGKMQKALSFHVTPHMLRHTYATMLYKAGIDLRTAQYLLGHSDIRMTADIYTHLEKEDAKTSVSLINDYLEGKGKKSKSSQKVVKAQNE